jgi:hypothetical protein
LCPVAGPCQFKLALFRIPEQALGPSSQGLDWDATAFQPVGFRV